VIPLAAVLLAGFFEFLNKYIKSKAVIPLARFGLGAILLVGMGGGYYMLNNDDYRNEPIYYKKVADFMGHDSKIIALSQDYGNRIAYFGWITPKPWKIGGNIDQTSNLESEMDLFEVYFRDFIEGYDYFVITRITVFNRQELLNDTLFQNFEIHEVDTGYIIFDLNKELDS